MPIENPYTATQEGVATTYVSPTGSPVIPPQAVPYVLLGVGLLEVVSSEMENPAPWDGARVVRLGLKVLTYFALGASPGLRRKDGGQ